MEIEILYVILLLIFIAIIAYVFFNCNCSCNVREGFSECRCANGTPHNGYCNSGSATRWFGKVNDVCGSCNYGYKRSSLKRKNRKYTWTCDSDPAHQPALCPAGFELKFDSSENKYKCATCPTGKYKSGKNANECLPCKTTCPSGKTLNGSCPPGSTSDTKTCKAIQTNKQTNKLIQHSDVQKQTKSKRYKQTGKKQTQNNNWEKKDNGISYENIYRYGYYPRNIKRIGENDLPASKKRCQDMGNECAAIYEYNWGNKKFYFAATADSEQKASNSIVNGVVEDINHIYLNGNMKSKYVK